MDSRIAISDPVTDRACLHCGVVLTPRELQRSHDDKTVPLCEAHAELNAPVAAQDAGDGYGMGC